MHGTPITVGTEIYFPTANGGAGNGPAIRRGTVTAIEPESHRGYGYWTRRLKVRQVANGKIAIVPYPANCLVILDTCYTAEGTLLE
jgi:hypothetical protein